MKTLLFPFAITVAACSISITSADEIKEAIDEGVSAYEQGDYSTAASQLEYASTLIRQKKAGQVTDVFCDPLSGWEAKDAESAAAGGMMAGGAISANREYNSGDKRVRIEMIMDSPMLQSVMILFNNPSMMAMSGGKLKKVQGNKAMIKQDGSRLTLTFVVNGNALFTLHGSNGTTEDDLLAYGECLKLAALN